MNPRDTPSKATETSPPELSGAAAPPDGGPPDEVYVERAQGGDLEAFDRLVTRHRGRIFTMIQHLVQNEADAWDLAQDAFVKAWRALPRFQGQSRFYTWLYRVAHNVVYDWLRKKSNASGNLREYDETIANEGIIAEAPTAPRAVESPDRAAELKDLRRDIQAALEKLSPEHRETILLREVEGLKYEEIAERMDCSPGTVMSRLFYARRKLQESLQDTHLKTLNR
jgi:RNA polymerase sigma-70 factor (ECF subfamily)